MHIHLSGRSQCSILSIDQLFNGISHKIDGICITDHWILKPIKFLTFYELKTFFGVEITSDLGDILAYGIKTVPPKGLKTKETIDYIHKQGGVAVCAHPFSNRHIAFGDKVFDFNFDAIEINGSIGKKYNNLAKRAATIMDLPTTGGSDAHSNSQLNTYCTKFFNPVFSADDIVKAIKTKECKAIRL